MQAIALGELGSLAEARAVVRRSFEVQSYQPAHQEGWDEALVKLQTMMQANLP
jgi:hypothetical protein